MRKNFIGIRLRTLRAERGMSQVALSQAAGLSASYVNQIEQNQRPLTVAAMLKISRVLDVDLRAFSEDEESRLVADMRDALADNPGGEPVALTELHEIASQMPAVGRALLALHQRNIEWMARLETMSEELGDGRGGVLPARPMPFEVVRDFFFAHQNYFDALDTAAEATAAQFAVQGATLGEWLVKRLADQHGVRVLPADNVSADSQRRYDPLRRVLTVSSELATGQQAFQLATQLALLEHDEPIRQLTEVPELADTASRTLARIGLANYFAGALLLPYGEFLRAAETLRYDIDLLARRFGVGFETICHRLSTLQRSGSPGVPFFFIRVDRAGNISKRQSATHFHFSKTGGTCPLWNVYEAFAQPGKVLTQLARMPDGRAYLWVARTVSQGLMGYGSPRKTFAVAMGCDIRHAPRLVYSKGLDLHDAEVPTPIGMGCKVCEREACPQRAFPFAGRPLDVDENDRRFTPYPVA
ncbi:short-chain fatty acyl-CoA regulator family protein [Xylophilus sp. GOD-11R]|uniref:short-chain fatty acyl-CoA regulator family protein n=1 Tax=Xylophilus sp. GOD-11R TaxID=3089814 RepID=UPI00298D06D1|nr:short-chain fatty acyl-CoA regulator family protein [Xylophilus sp. GOD-11R]WPB57905.1 short-chain fatty acyl-CoA regulator family protein [Xylophilus sp. GOD-11R]